EVEDLETTRNQETLGLTGTIYKRKWEADGQVENLYRAAAYYRRGHQEGVANDLGLTSINAAFTLDLLSYQEQIASQQSGSSSAYVTARRVEADNIRREVIAVLNKLATDKLKLQKEWRILTTLPEEQIRIGENDGGPRWLG